MANPVENFRLKITDTFGNVSFFVRRDGKTSFLSASETPLALSNVASANATVLRFAMEDAANGADAAKVFRQLARFAKTVEVL